MLYSIPILWMWKGCEPRALVGYHTLYYIPTVWTWKGCEPRAPVLWSFLCVSVEEIGLTLPKQQWASHLGSRYMLADLARLLWLVTRMGQRTWSITWSTREIWTAWRTRGNFGSHGLPWARARLSPRRCMGCLLLKGWFWPHCPAQAFLVLLPDTNRVNASDSTLRGPELPSLFKCS